MRLQSIPVLCACLLMLATAAVTARVPSADLKKEVADAERAFAATMKARDHAAFATFVSDEAVFFSNGTPLRGKEAVVAAWKPYYDKAQAPFSWEPEEVEVVPSGTLAYSGGSVYDQNGKRIGRFNSIWRLEAPGTWKVVFDRGSDFGNCQK